MNAEIIIVLVITLFVLFVLVVRAKIKSKYAELSYNRDLNRRYSEKCGRRVNRKGV